MSLYFQCANPRQLLADFKKAIDEKTIATWGYESWPRLSEQFPARDKWRSAGFGLLLAACGLRRRKGVARPELQPRTRPRKIHAAAASGDGLK